MVKDYENTYSGLVTSSRSVNYSLVAIYVIRNTNVGCIMILGMTSQFRGNSLSLHCKDRRLDPRPPGVFTAVFPFLDG